MYKKYFSIAIGLIFSANALQAQTTNVNDADIVAVKQVIQNMFTAMKNSDTLLLKTCFSPTTVFQTVISKQGETLVKDEKVQDFFNSIGKQPAGALDERIVFETVRANKDLAIAWTPYEFYYKDKYSHNGVNSFQLVKLNGEWKIHYLIDTRYK
ncbi:MAG: hypothetical protein RLZ95_1430 [Bacteroidota bacterium]|jgi:hypothetical protein